MIVFTRVIMLTDAHVVRVIVRLISLVTISGVSDRNCSG